MSPRRLLALCALLVTVVVAPAAGTAAAAVVVPAGFDQQVLGSGLTQPTQAAWAPDGRIFVTEKPGRIRVITAGGTLLSTPLIDIRARVNTVQDRGLLGIALSPSFATDHQLYYAYTYDLQPSTPDSDAPMVARIERVTVNNDNTAGATTVVLGQDVSGPCPRVADDCMPSDGKSHSIGTIRFGPDGTLWIGLGDSASYAQVDDLAFRAQEEGVMSGKILHVDTNGRGLANHPFCPGVTDLTKACTKIFAKGFRNPYRFTLDNGVPMVGDVGWGDREELDRVVAGGNYGWPCFEGDRHTTGYSSDPRCTAMYDAGGATGPLYTYSHNNAGAAIIGGPRMPASSPYGSPYTGDLFIGDYARGTVQRVDLAPDGTCTTTPCTVTDFVSSDWVGTDLELSPAGNLAWTLFGTGGPDGSLVEVLKTGANPNHRPVAAATATPLGDAAKRGYRFSAAGSTDQDGDPLTMRWDFGDGTATQTGVTVQHTYATSVTDATATVTVTDGRGGSATATVTVTPGDLPPEPRITAPADGARFTDGQPVQLRGTATDREDGTLSGTALHWQVTLYHGTHVHPGPDLTGSQATFTPWDDHDADSHYAITLVATDSAGNRVETAPVSIQPNTVALTLASNPPGVSLGFGELTLTTPAVHDAAVGFHTTVTAPAVFTTAGTTYRFAGWSDGGAAQHALTVPSVATTLTADYRADATAGSTPVTTPLAPLGPASDAPKPAAHRTTRTCRAATRGRPVTSMTLRRTRTRAILSFRARRNVAVRIVVRHRDGRSVTLHRIRRLRACHVYRLTLGPSVTRARLSTRAGSFTVRSPR